VSLKVGELGRCSNGVTPPALPYSRKLVSVPRSVLVLRLWPVNFFPERMTINFLSVFGEGGLTAIHVPQEGELGGFFGLYPSARP
jgi:hypothetical protein